MHSAKPSSSHHSSKRFLRCKPNVVDSPSPIKENRAERSSRKELKDVCPAPQYRQTERSSMEESQRSLDQFLESGPSQVYQDPLGSEEVRDLLGYESTPMEVGPAPPTPLATPEQASQESLRSQDIWVEPPPTPHPEGRAKAKAKPRVRRKPNKFGKVPTNSEHNIFTHFPKCSKCPVCNETKTQRARCQVSGDVKPDGLPLPKEFGDAITADHAVINDKDKSRLHDRAALIVQDRATHYCMGYPQSTREAHTTAMSLQRFMGPGQKPKYMYTDASRELIKAGEDLKWLHDTSTPNRPETHGVAERAVRRVKEGTSTAIVQSGLSEAWWDYAMPCYCFLRNIVDKVQSTDGRCETPHQRRFGEEFRGPVIPFGAEIQFCLHP